MRTRIVIVCGPTASGKSALAQDIAADKGGVIVNADAMQVYRELRIVTARPTEAQEARVPHLLYGSLSAAERCSAGRWLNLAKAAIDATLEQGKIPIITGGTGLYIKALIHGISPVPDIAPEVKNAAQELCDEIGSARLHRKLAERDPEMARKLRPSDPQRLVRAWEVLQQTGKSLLWWQVQPGQKPYPNASFDLVRTAVPRDELYRRCDARFLQMVEAGAVDEVRALAAMNLDPRLPAMRAVGVPELLRYINGQSTLEDAIAKAQQATRNYAKRQFTWFRNQLPG